MVLKDRSSQMDQKPSRSTSHRKAKGTHSWRATGPLTVDTNHTFNELCSIVTWPEIDYPNVLQLSAVCNAPAIIALS